MKSMTNIPNIPNLLRACTLLCMLTLSLLGVGVGMGMGMGMGAVMQSAPQPVWQEVLSNDGSWKVKWRVVIGARPAELPVVRRRFSLELHIESTRDPKQIVTAVLVDAQMPEHAHGMNVAPTILLEPGGAVAEGMLFHMSGRWEVDVDIDDGVTVERAQWNILMY